MMSRPNFAISRSFPERRPSPSPSNNDSVIRKDKLP